MITRIYIDKHIINANRKNNENNPPISVRQKNKVTKAHKIKVVGEMYIVYKPEKPLSCGAVVWLETKDDVNILE